MDQAAVSSAKTGVWTDATTNKTTLIVNSSLGFFITSLLAIWLGLCAKYVKKILANIAHGVHVRWHSRLQLNTDVTTEETPLLENRKTQAERDADALAKIYKNAHDVRDIYQALFAELLPSSTPLVGKDPKALTWGYWFCLLVFTIAFSIFALAIIVGGLYLVRVRTDGPALLHSNQAGLWILAPGQSQEEQTRAMLRRLEKESRAGDYASTCYGTPTTAFDSPRCDLLYQRQLKTKMDRLPTSECPFDQDICAPYQPVVFETGLIDAGDIGINQKNGPKFRRKTTCAVLNWNSTYIRNETNSAGQQVFYYYYGGKPTHKPPLEYTYTSNGDPFDRTSPVYDVAVYTYDNDDDPNPAWKPIDQLLPPDNSTLTLILVHALRVLYKDSSGDPLFPAWMPYSVPGSDERYFRNGDPKYRPLGCISSIEACLSNGTTCWPMNKDWRDVSTHDPDFWLMYTSLAFTDIVDAIERRLGRALLAQDKVSQYYSEALGEEQWVDEVTHLEETCLARTQINAWSIATAEDAHHNATYDRAPPLSTTGDMRGLFKYNPQGYASFDFAAFLAVLCLLPLMWILSWDLKEHMVPWAISKRGQKLSSKVSRPTSTSTGADQAPQSPRARHVSSSPSRGGLEITDEHQSIPQEQPQATQEDSQTTQEATGSVQAATEEASQTQSIHGESVPGSEASSRSHTGKGQSKKGKEPAIRPPSATAPGSSPEGPASTTPAQIEDVEAQQVEDAKDDRLMIWDPLVGTLILWGILQVITGGFMELKKGASWVRARASRPGT